MKIDTLTVRNTDGTSSTFKPDVKEWYWIKPDWLTHLHNGTIRSNNLTDRGDGTPCVFRTGQKGSANKWNPLSVNPVEMDAKCQTFAADLLAFKKYGARFSELEPTERETIKTKFTALYSEGLAYCNNVSWGETDVYWNYIKNENPGAPWPKMHALIDGTDCYTGEIDGDYIRLDSWTPATIPEDYDFSILKDSRVAWCTIIRPTVIDGGFSVYQFPQLGGLPVPRPFITREPVYYWRDEVIECNERQPLFWPPREGTP